MNQTNSTCMITSMLDCLTGSQNTAKNGESLELPVVVILCTLLGVASVLGTLGNCLVLLSVIKFEYLRTIPDLFIFSLSASDVLVTTLFQPMKAYGLAHSKQVSAMPIFSIVSSFLGHFSLVASITNMFGVTVERLISIRFPLKYPVVVTTRRAHVVIAGIWVFSLTSGALVANHILPNVFFGVYFSVILMGTISIYIYIFVVARKLENAVIQVQNNSNRRDSNGERKAAKTIIIILGVAVVCWLPFLVVLPFLSRDEDPATFYTVFYCLHVLSVCNSSINPYIYCARSSRYRISFIKLLNLNRFPKFSVSVAPGNSLGQPIHSVPVVIDLAEK